MLSEEVIHLRSSAFRADWEEGILCDTSIKVFVGKKEVQKYEVHRCSLAGGSKYFRDKLINSGSPPKDFIMKVNDGQAKVIPFFLDYIYNIGHRRGEIPEDGILPLLELAQEYGVDDLTFSIKKYLQEENHLTWKILEDGFEVLYSMAKDTKVEKKMIDVTVKNFNVIDKESKIFVFSSPEFWVKVLNQLMLDANGSTKQMIHRKWEQLICPYLKAFHQNKMQTVAPENIEMLTKEDYLPDLRDFDTALELHSILDQIDGLEEEDPPIMNLKKRIMACLSRGFHHAFKKKDIHGFIKGLEFLNGLNDSDVKEFCMSVLKSLWDQFVGASLVVLTNQDSESDGASQHTGATPEDNRSESDDEECEEQEEPSPTKYPSPKIKKRGQRGRPAGNSSAKKMKRSSKG